MLFLFVQGRDVFHFFVPIMLGFFRKRMWCFSLYFVPIMFLYFCRETWSLSSFSVPIKFLGAKKRLYKRLRRSVHWSVRPSVRWSVRMSPRCNYVENWLRRDCFERRRRKRKLITSRFHYVAIPSRLGIRWSPCFIFVFHFSIPIMFFRREQAPL
jgi:hypothetical protein